MITTAQSHFLCSTITKIEDWIELCSINWIFERNNFSFLYSFLPVFLFSSHSYRWIHWRIRNVSKKKRANAFHHENPHWSTWFHTSFVSAIEPALFNIQSIRIYHARWFRDFRDKISTKEFHFSIITKHRHSFVYDLFCLISRNLPLTDEVVCLSLC